MKHYAVREDTGAKVLVELECDECGARIKPGPDISKLGWIKHVYDNGPGKDKFEYEYCQDCSPFVMLGGA